ncbi:MAG: phenylalanine--tRNA ligase subunit beta [Planctomycetes bacterium]|nr:phenylalanine--tRNA ligase subunit beta [Planctomycetota bacterium]
MSGTVLTSVNWMNEYLDPPASAREQAELLTRAGFPLEASEALNGSDTRQDYEMTSNRGGCVCHIGLAREIAAISGRRLIPCEAEPSVTGGPARDAITVTNREWELCPLYTGRVIRGVTIGPSPRWLADRLRAIDQIPRNNIVDATNFVLFEMGQPTHVFDLAKLAGPRIIVRLADSGERFVPIGEGAVEVTLTGEDLVIADAERAIAIAGVKGGAATAVSESTTDLLLEAATFDPVAVRNTSRRHGIDSESSYRFERGVHPGQIEPAARRLAGLILDVAGGTLHEGVVSDGAPIPPPLTVSMRTGRCRDVLGVPIADEQMASWLAALDFAPVLDGGSIHCTVPVHRLDIEREIDLIEEVGRMMGHDTLPVTDTIEIRVVPVQPAQLARRAINDALVGFGFVETVTHGLLGTRDAEPFIPDGSEILGLAADTATAEHTQAGSVLRPSVVPSLLRVLARNHDNGVRPLKLFESAATFLRTGTTHMERRQLTLVMDAPGSRAADSGVRTLRGVIERLIEILMGPEALVDIVPDDGARWYAPGGAVLVSGLSIGRVGLLAPEIARSFGLDEPVAVAELDLSDIAESYPPDTEAHGLANFPAVERDVSAIVSEQTTWATLRGVIDGLRLEHVEAVELVEIYRGKPIDSGRKSVTVRLRFRAPDRTLVHDSVDVQVEALIGALTAELGAEIRR